jgi:predicted dehydrogenase
MRQVVQDLRSGRLDVDDLPSPCLVDSSLLVANEYSLISAGTERATVDLARKGLVAKAQARPDLVRKVLESLGRDGLAATVRLVNTRLDRRKSLGYSCAGVVLAVGRDVTGFAVGDRVACAGQDYASHAEVVCVPASLCVRVPDAVATADAAYVALGAIALHGVRQAAPSIGETLAVIGLGLVGQIVAQVLRANGCRVIASDLDPARLELARTLGAPHAVLPGDLAATCAAETDGRGVDGVIITASSASNQPVEAAAEICRHKGRVVVVGSVGMNLPREPFYRKELELRLSTSYGPGRYDAAYEERGIDYPYGYVRWTEGRNLAAFLALVAAGSVDVARLTSHRFDIADAASAYELMQARAPSLGILLRYPAPALRAPERPRLRLRPPAPAARVCLGLIGPGNHVRDRLLPSLRSRRDVTLHAVCSASGVNGKRIAATLDAEYCTTDYREILADAAVDTVLVGTRHDSHARIVCDALAAGKHVFVEKPLCLSESELADVERAWAAAMQRRNTILCVGFNRRHSVHVTRIAQTFAGRRRPLLLHYRVNAGPLPAEHWVHAQGGRLLGEACHFVDTLIAIAGDVRRVSTVATDPGAQSFTITLEHADGSVGTIQYSGDGDRSVAKERLEVMGDGRVAIMDDFATTAFHHAGKRTRVRTARRDKGFEAEIARFVDMIRDDAPAQPEFDAVRRSTLVTLRAHASLAARTPIEIP